MCLVECLEIIQRKGIIHVQCTSKSRYSAPAKTPMVGVLDKEQGQCQDCHLYPFFSL